MKTVPTFWAKIYVAHRKGYASDSFVSLLDVCQNYVDRVGLCVTFTSTRFVYTKNSEYGLEVGLINYPRFPSTPKEIRRHALALARRLKAKARQSHVTVVMPDETVMLGD